MATHSSILAWNIPWQGSLMGYSPWGCKESDGTEHALSCPFEPQLLLKSRQRKF